MGQSLDRLVKYYSTRGGTPGWLAYKLKRRADTRIKTFSPGMLSMGVAAAVVSCARGSYQYDLVTSGGTWSGAGLRGKAAKWSGRYAQSRASLVKRINDKLARCFKGWSAHSMMLFNYESRRVERRLVLRGPGGGLYRW